METSLNKRTLVLAAIAVAVLVVLQLYSLSFGSKKQPAVSEPAEQPMKILGEAKLILEDGGSKPREFAGPVVEGMQVWQALLQAAEAGSFKISYRIEPDRFLVNAIADKKAIAGKWSFYRNGQRLDEAGVLNAALAPGDVIRVVYEGR